MRNYRWIVVGVAVALAVAGSLAFARWQAAAAPGYGPQAFGPGMMGQYWQNQNAAAPNGGAPAPGFAVPGAPGAPVPGTPGNGWYPGGMMGGWAQGGNPRQAAQAAQWMLQMHNAMWGAYNGAPDGTAGSGQGEELIPSAPAKPGAQRVEKTISLREWSIDPTQLQVPAGSRLVLTVKNDGTMEHHFAIPGLGLRLTDIAPGASRTVELNVDNTGAYPYLCDIPGHAQFGQRGVLTVTAGGQQ